MEYVLNSEVPTNLVGKSYREFIDKWSSLNPKLYTDQSSLAVSHESIWLRLEIAPVDTARILKVSLGLPELIELWHFSNDQLIGHTRAGLRAGRLNRNWIASEPTLLIDRSVTQDQPPEHPDTLLLKVNSPNLNNLAISIGDYGEIENTIDFSNAVFFLYVGISLIILLYNFSVLMSFHDYAGLSFTIYTISTFITIAFHFGLIDFLFGGESTILFRPLNAITISLAGISLYYFLSHLFDSPKDKQLSRIMIVFSLLNGISGVLRVFDQTHFIFYRNLSIYIQSAWGILIFTYLILAIKNKKPFSLPVFFAFSPILFYVIFRESSLFRGGTLDSTTLPVLFCVFNLLSLTYVFYQRLNSIQSRLLLSEGRHQENLRLQHTLSSLSHDLANFLMVIRMNANIISLEMNLKDFNLRKNRIQNMSEKAQTLIGSLRFWLQVDTHNVQLEKVNLYDCLNESLDCFTEKLEQKQIRILKENMDCIQSHHILAIKVLLVSQVLNNVFSNAIKFSPPGGNIFIKSECNDQQITLSILDSGDGIKEEQIKLFKDNKINTSTLGTHNEKGSGLGLLVLKKTVESFNGTIVIESPLQHEKNFGTKVTMTFILADSDTNQLSPKSA